MAAPTSLTSATTIVTVDGTDLHVYGMVVQRVENPPPQVRRSTVTLFNRDGDYDFTRNYEPRTMMISGVIIGNTNSDLCSYLDSLKTFFRLRENGDSFQVIFQNQSTRYWTCKYDGAFNIDHVSRWYNGRIANFSLALKCTKPYAEKTTVTESTVRHDIFKNLSLTYNGTYPAPLNVTLKSPMDVNILEKVGGDTSEDHTPWDAGVINAVATDVDDTGLGFAYGLSAVRFTQSGAGEFGSIIDVTAEIDITKNYVFGMFARNSGSNTKTKLYILNNGAGGDQSSALASGDHFIFVKITAAMMVGATAVKFYAYDEGDVNTTFDIDGAFIYEITAAEAADSAYFPPPYLSDPSADDARETVNPRLQILNGYNLFPYGHGDSLGEASTGTNPRKWTAAQYSTIHVVADPFDQDSKCLALWGTTDSGIILSPYMSLTPGKIYQLRYSFYIKNVATGKTGTVKFMGSYEGNTDGAAVIPGTQTNISAAGSGWASIVVDLTALKYQSLIYLQANLQTDVILMLKNIQITEVASAGLPTVAYQKQVANFMEWLSTLASGDRVEINSETLLVNHYDYSAHDVINGMTYFNGEKGLYLLPGANVLKYSDNRYGAVSPQNGAGSVTLGYSYRERYI